MKLIDTHGHLNFAAFTDTWQTVLAVSKERGVVGVVMPGSQLATSERAIELARLEPGVLSAAVGLHPTHIAPIVESKNLEGRGKNQTEKFEVFDFQRYLELARLPEVVAIGEVGLDTYRVQNQNAEIKHQNGNGDFTIEDVLKTQTEVLAGFIRIAQAVNKPMILHCRGQKKPGGRPPPTAYSLELDPHERLISILSAIPEQLRPKFVVHCYQGTVEQAGRYLALGGLISFTGTITYSDDAAVTQVVRAVPLARLMIETDSPYLSPVPYRGETNEPWKVIEVARRIGELKGIDLATVAASTLATAEGFFGL